MGCVYSLSRPPRPFHLVFEPVCTARSDMRRVLSFQYAFCSLLWLGWNIFVICIYLEVGILSRVSGWCACADAPLSLAHDRFSASCVALRCTQWGVLAASSAAAKHTCSTSLQIQLPYFGRVHKQYNKIYLSNQKSKGISLTIFKVLSIQTADEPNSEVLEIM